MANTEKLKPSQVLLVCFASCLIGCVIAAATLYYLAFMFVLILFVVFFVSGGVFSHFFRDDRRAYYCGSHAFGFGILSAVIVARVFYVPTIFSIEDLILLALLVAFMEAAILLIPENSGQQNATERMR